MTGRNQLVSVRLGLSPLAELERVTFDVRGALLCSVASQGVLMEKRHGVTTLTS